MVTRQMLNELFELSDFTFSIIINVEYKKNSLVGMNVEDSIELKVRKEFITERQGSPEQVQFYNH